MPVQFMEIRDRGGKFRFREEEELGFFNFLSFEVLVLKTKGDMGLELRKVCTVSGELKTLALRSKDIDEACHERRVPCT